MMNIITRFIKRNIKYIIIMAIIGFLFDSTKGIIEGIFIYIYCIFISGVWYYDDEWFDD